MSLRYSYNTNGCVHHRLDDAIGMIADAGYDGVALTPDVQHLDPFAPDHAQARKAFARNVARRGLGCSVETGARFVLGRNKHDPSMLSPDAEGRALRLEFLGRCCEIVAEAGGETVSFWSGNRPASMSRDAAFDHLRAGVETVLRRAEALGVTASMEPEPGMLVETAGGWAEFAAEFPALRLALDTGHCMVTGEIEPEDAVRAHGARLGTVHLEDMLRGIHEHLPFGEGEMDVRAVLRALNDMGYDRLVALELSRDSHRAEFMIPEARRQVAALEHAA